MEQWTIGDDEAGVRIDAWLARRPEIGSRQRARTAIERGKVFLNDAEIAFKDAGGRLQRGDRVGLWIDRPGTSRPRARGIASFRPVLRVVYEDRALLVADKPAGLLVEPLAAMRDSGPLFRRRHSGGGRFTEARNLEAAEITLCDLVADHLRSSSSAGGSPPLPARRSRSTARARPPSARRPVHPADAAGAVETRPLVVHRIDRDTSGLVLFAKTPAAQAALKSQFERHTADRLYWTVLRGRVQPSEGTWRDELVWDRERLIQKRAHPRESRAKEAVARYRVIEQFRSAALVEVALVTGKRNQIRVQAGLRGHPVVGERLYSFGAAPPARGEPELGRQALHACRLSFAHPATGARVTVTAPLSDDLRALIESLRRARGQRSPGSCLTNPPHRP